jgi:SAM-dependent methyltransferase
MPDRYEIQRVREAPIIVYLARTDTDVIQMASLIARHRFYDRFGVWTPVIDLDKQITATIIRALGTRNCFELGCFTGSVLSILAEAGISVLGADVSHLAFAFAYPNVRENMVFGDLLTLDIDERFDAILCMDVLEHISPLQLDRYLEKLVALTERDGYIYLNSPMWGQDRVFGVVEDPYLDEWLSVGEASYWRHWPCDERGWPLHGHLVWASPQWWERKFHAYGLIRDTIVENAIQQCLAGFFQHAPGRRSLFVLRRADNRRSSETGADSISAALARLMVKPL